MFLYTFGYDLSFLLHVFIPALGYALPTSYRSTLFTSCGSALLPAVGPLFSLLRFTPTIQLVVLVLRLLRLSVDDPLSSNPIFELLVFGAIRHLSCHATLLFELCPLPGVAILRVRQSRAASAGLTPPVQCEALVSPKSFAVSTSCLLVHVLTHVFSSAALSTHLRVLRVVCWTDRHHSSLPRAQCVEVFGFRILALICCFTSPSSPVCSSLRAFVRVRS